MALQSSILLLNNLYEEYRIEKHAYDYLTSSTSYYPYGNGQAEATTKTLLCILNKMVYEELKR